MRNTAVMLSEAKTDAISRPITMPSLSMGVSSVFGQGRRSAGSRLGREAGGMGVHRSFVCAQNDKTGSDSFVEGEQPAEIYFTSTFSKYCATCTFHPKSFFITSRS